MLKLKGEMRGAKEMKDEVSLLSLLHAWSWLCVTMNFFSSFMIQNSSNKEYYSAIRNDKYPPFALTWMDLEGMMLSEGSQSKKDKQCMFSFILEDVMLKPYNTSRMP